MNLTKLENTTDFALESIAFVTCALTDCSDTGPEEAASASLAWTVPILLKYPRRHCNLMI